MAYILAVVFGLSWGVLVCWIDTRTRALLPKVCCAAILLVATTQLILTGPTASIPGLVLAIAATLGFVFAAGALWKEHPALEGLSYNERVRTMLVKGSAIRAHRDELPVNVRPDAEREATGASHMTR